jgi:3-dehydroquinate synthase
MHSLNAVGFTPFSVIIPDGEKFKNLNSVEIILTRLLQEHLDRKACLIALGGGVIGDITGFAASIYMRGINFVQVPTTLLAQVDSSVGGKTGVNHHLGKNMIGTFYQPKLVCIDTATLSTLPQRELLCGISEVIKYGIIYDERFFAFLEQNRSSLLSLEPSALAEVIKTSCSIKAQVVEKDEYEGGLRAILNYGHTVGHAIETETAYERFLHGEAVAIGMVAAARLANYLQLLDSQSVMRIQALIATYGLPTEVPDDLDIEHLCDHMAIDKKAEFGKITFILPERIGAVQIKKDIDISIVRHFLHHVKQKNK